MRSNELLLTNYIAYVNHSTIALLQSDSSNQSFVLHCTKEGYWNRSALFSTPSMSDKNSTSKLF